MSLLLRFSGPFLVLFVFVHAETINSDPDDFELLKEEISELFTNGTVRASLPQHLSSYQMPQLFRGTKTIQGNIVVCSLCNYVFKQAITLRKNGATKDYLLNLMEFLCVSLNFGSERVCSGILNINADILIYLVDTSSRLTERKICGSLLQGLGCSNGGLYQWSVRLPSENFSTTKINNTDEESFQVLHLSDLHYDPDYKPYGNADCNEPLCCQNEQGPASSSSSTCGYWTDYRDADSSWHLIENTIKQVKTQDFKYVYFTGDIISHKVWDTSISKNADTISSFYSFFKENFDVPVFPIFGNHEPHPVNIWAPKRITDESFSTQWLYELAANFWSELVRENITQTVLKGGYYTVSPEPGFRIIAINSNLCYTFNFWLIYDDSDLRDHLQWLVDTLKEAEDNDERVHILSHIPVGTSECLLTWDREYSRIVERFSNVITGQFNGHSHWDEFRVFYSGTKPIGVAFNGASLTPYTWSNPSYKIYDVDATTFSLRDYEEWTFDLNEANSKPANNSIDWYKLYSFVEAYNVENLEPYQVDLVLYKMAENRSLLQDYYRFKYRESDHMMKIGCDEDCEVENLCQITTTVFGDRSQCSRLLNLYSRSRGFRFHYESYLMAAIVLLHLFTLRFGPCFIVSL